MALWSSRNSAECEPTQRGLRSRCWNVWPASAESVALYSALQGESRTNKKPAMNQPHDRNYAALKPPPRHFRRFSPALVSETNLVLADPRSAAILVLSLSIDENRLSDNVGGVKRFLRTLRQARGEERHFVLLEHVPI